MSALALRLEFDGRPVDVRVEGEDQLACAAHVCEYLGIKNVSDAVEKIPEQDRVLAFGEVGFPRGRWFLREAGVNRLVMRSNKRLLRQEVEPRARRTDG